MAIIILFFIYFITKFICSKIALISGGQRTCLLDDSSNVPVIYLNSLEPDKVSAWVMKTIENKGENNKFVNIVIANELTYIFEEIYGPSIFVHKAGDKNLKSENSLLSLSIKSDATEFIEGVNKYNPELPKNKVMYFHVDYGINGDIYNI